MLDELENLVQALNHSITSANSQELSYSLVSDIVHKCGENITKETIGNQSTQTHLIITQF